MLRGYEETLCLPNTELDLLSTFGILYTLDPFVHTGLVGIIGSSDPSGIFGHLIRKNLSQSSGRKETFVLKKTRANLSIYYRRHGRRTYAKSIHTEY